MSHKPGAYLGGVRNLDDLRGRCVMDDECGCWHLRSPRGRAMPLKSAHCVYSHIHHKKVVATRLAWLLSHPKLDEMPASKKKVWRTCSSYDCVNPKHLSAGSAKQWGKHLAKTGKAVSPAKTAAQLVLAEKRCCLTPELKTWLLESEQADVMAAHGLGIIRQRATQLRNYARKIELRRPMASVFEMAGRI